MLWCRNSTLHSYTLYFPFLFPFKSSEHCCEMVFWNKLSVPYSRCVFHSLCDESFVCLNCRNHSLIFPCAVDVYNLSSHYTPFKTIDVICINSLYMANKIQSFFSFCDLFVLCFLISTCLISLCGSLPIDETQSRNELEMQKAWKPDEWYEKLYIIWNLLVRMYFRWFCSVTIAYIEMKIV